MNYRNSNISTPVDTISGHCFAVLLLILVIIQKIAGLEKNFLCRIMESPLFNSYGLLFGSRNFHLFSSDAFSRLLQNKVLTSDLGGRQGRGFLALFFVSCFPFNLWFSGQNWTRNRMEIVWRLQNVAKTITLRLQQQEL